MITLDGSTLEGGGQLTRMALCLSAITGKAVKIHSIRAGRVGRIKKPTQSRSKHGRSSGEKRHDRGHDGQPDAARSKGIAGGLKESHLAALNWLAEQTAATVRGAEVGSTEVVFRPLSKINAAIMTKKAVLGKRDQLNVANCERETIRLKNPGSIWLIFQAIYPFMVFSSPQLAERVETDDSIARHGRGDDREGNEIGLLYDITLEGGTNVPMSMSTEYVQQVFAPVCELMGLPRIRIETIKQGWTTGPLQVGQVRVRMYGPRVGSGKPVKEVLTTTNDTSSQLISKTEAMSLTKSQTTSHFILQPFKLTDRGAITQIEITILATPDLFATITDETISEITTHRTYLSLPSQPDLKIHSTIDSGHSRRLYILLVAHTTTKLRIGRDFLASGASLTNEPTARKPKLSRREIETSNEKKPSSQLKSGIRKVVNELMHEIEKGVCVDEFMQDQLVTFQALAEGESCVSGFGDLSHDKSQDYDGESDDHDNEDGDQTSTTITPTMGDDSGSLHTRTVRWVCEEMLRGHGVGVGVKFSPGGKCRGVGWNGAGHKLGLEKVGDEDGLDDED